MIKMVKVANVKLEDSIIETLEIIAEHMCKDESGTRNKEDIIKDFNDSETYYVLITENDEVKINYNKQAKEFMIRVNFGNVFMTEKLEKRFINLMSFRNAANECIKRTYASDELLQIAKEIEKIKDDEVMDSGEKEDRLFKLTMKSLGKIKKLEEIEKIFKEHILK